MSTKKEKSMPSRGLEKQEAVLLDLWNFTFTGFGISHPQTKIGKCGVAAYQKSSRKKTGSLNDLGMIHNRS